MGKISDALNKYAKERKQVQKSRLNSSDVDALLRYDRETGHLLNYNDQAGEIGFSGMEALRNKGTIQRLLDNKLIFPGGKLTEKGLQESERLSKLRGGAASPAPAPENTPEYDRQADIDALPAVSEIEKEVFRLHRDLTKEALAVEPSQVKVSPLVEPAQEEKMLKLQKPEPPKVVQPPKPEPVETPPLQAKKEEAPPVEKRIEVKKPEADMFISAFEANERDAAQKPQIIESSDSDSQPKYDESAIDENMVSLLDPQSYEAEQFKILRTNILYPVSGTSPQSILVTSSLPGEGKSFVSANLAISIALNVNKHVLLIDCDLRKPDIHHRFGFGNVQGLSDYLGDHTDLASLLLKTRVDKLTLLPGGPTPPNPSELMSSEKMVELLEEVKYRYHDRLIVIDSPPPSMAAETSFLARHVDGIVVVAKHGKTPKEALEDLIERMGSEKILGTVVNFIDPGSRYYGYKKYGQYGRRYGYGKGKTKNKNA